MGVLGLDLGGLDLREGLNGGETGVLSENNGDVLKGLREGAEGVLVKSIGLVGFLRNANGASNFGTATSVRNTVVLDEVTDDAHGIVKRAHGFINDHSVSSTYQHSDSTAIRALLEEDHAVGLSSKVNLADATDSSELISCQFRETGDNTSTTGNSEKFDLDTTDPTDRGELVLEKKMVGFIIETPLADDEVGTRVLDLLDHFGEVLLLHLGELLVVLLLGDIELVAGLGLRGLERASQDGDLGVVEVLGHLGVTHLLVKNDSSDEAGVFEASSDLTIDLDHIKVDIFVLEVGDRKDSVDSDLGHLLLETVDDLGTESGVSSTVQGLSVLGGPVNGISDLAEVLDSNVTGLFETLGDLGGVDSIVE